MNGFARRTEQKKQAIKQAVLQLLQTNDPREITIQAIAKRAHVSPVTIYNHFGSKENLIRETLMDDVIRQVEEFEAFSKQDHSFEEKVKHTIFQKVNMFKEGRVNIVQRLMQEDEEFRRLVERLYETRVLPLVVEMIRQAQEKGEVDPRLSIEALLLYLNGWRELSEKILSSFYSERLVEEMVRLFFYGIKGETR
ncbi:TetR/AcrR family transcriptional regulator [Geobacillus jurassicus]|uniref:TetR/AcrR family transcriptional regulator n=1 Tax=Geobacillus jurassicus TaxID=235932 RepID=A0ABV6GQB2_9BACL|nr:TetR/AcrR family transcriptional regulator [Geobacillus jurassicus]